MIQPSRDASAAKSSPSRLEGARGAASNVALLKFGDYVLEEEIAHGGVGVVYRARQSSLGRIVAVKLLLLGRYSSAETIERFRREAKSAAALRHPNIVAIHEIGEHDGQQFFSMDYVEGQSLAQELRAGPFEPRRAAELVCAVARAIHYAHEQGVLHRDLKPSNVLLDVFGQVRITDFGLAKKLDGSSDLTLTGQVVGTPNYLSPEQAAGLQAELGPASDVYSIGALMYELLTGRPPFLANSLQETLLRIKDSEPVSPHALNPGIHRDLETICLKCLRKEPARRYATALALAEDLERWLDNQPIEARPVGLPERAWLWARRRPRQAITLAIAVSLFVALFVTLAIANFRISAAHRQTQLKAAESLHRLAQLNVASGNRLVSDGDWEDALLWFVEALRLEQGDPHLEEIHRRRIGAVMRMGPRVSQLFLHDTLLNSAEMSEDGSLVATASVDGTIRVWNAQTGQLAFSPMAHPGVTSAWFTRQGRFVLSLARDHSLRIWDAHSGQLVGDPLQLTTSNPADTHLSVDGRWFAVPEDKGAVIFDAGTMQPLPQPLPLLGRAQCVQFSSDGRLLAVAETVGGVRIWNLASNPPTNHFFRLPKPSTGLQLDPSARRMATLFDRSNLQLWDVETGLAVGPVMPQPAAVYSYEFRPDGRWLASACWDGMVRLWNVETGQPARAPLAHGSGVRTAQFTQDGSRLVTVTWDSFIRVWDPDSGRAVCPIIRQVGFEAGASPSVDGVSLLVGSHDPCVRKWELPPSRPARLTLRHNGTMEQAHFSPDGKFILTSGDDSTAKIWDSATGKLVRTLSHPGDLRTSCFSPDGKTAVTAAQDGSTRVWDFATGTLRAQTTGQTGIVSLVEFSADSSRFATASFDGTARVWRTSDCAPLTPLINFGGTPGASMFFSPDAKRILTASGKDAQLWDATTGAPIGPRLKQHDALTTVAISPDGRYLLTAGYDNTPLPYSAQLWDAKTFQPVGQPMPHMDGIRSVAFSPDGSRIVTGGEDNCAQIWSGTTGERLTPALPHLGYVFYGYFSPDGSLLLTVSEDSTARVWDAATGEPVTPPLRHEARVHFGSWSPDGREVVTCSNDGTASVWDVSPTHASLEELQLRAEVTSAHYLKADIGALPLDTKEIETRWRALGRLTPTSPQFSTPAR